MSQTLDPLGSAVHTGLQSPASNNPIAVLRVPQRAPRRLLGNLHRHEFQGAPGIPERDYDIFGGQSPHRQRQVALERCLDGAAIDPLHVFSGPSATNHLHQKFCVLHSLLCCREVLLRRSRCTGMRRGNAARETSFQLRVNQTSRYCLDEIRARIGSENSALSKVNRSSSGPEIN